MVMKKRYGWKTELKHLLRQHNHLAAHRNKVVGTETKKKREDILYLGFAELHELGYKIENPRNFREIHIRVLARHWEEQGKSSATIQNRISTFRVFAEWIGKPGMIGDSTKYVQNPEAAKRRQVADRDKSWDANNADFEQLLERIEAYDERLAVMAIISKAFGLRRKEVITFRPHLAERNFKEQSCIVVEFGTKGGRPRVVPVELPIQELALARAKKLVKSVRGSLGWEGLTLKQSLSKFSNGMTRLGINKKELGVTFHGLRHQYANEKYERMTGVPSPVRGGKRGEVDPETDYKARMLTSEALGHSRTSVTASYYGSHRSVSATNSG
jgi:integrase